MSNAQHPGHGDCSEVLHHIYEYLDGEMSPEDVRRVATHLAECRPCLAEHDLDAAVKQVVKRSCPDEAVPDALRMRVVRSITVVRSEREG
ncbi:mycothiol system anti-sigma-R factor [Phycicoccus flavus]|uniref:mycothiol system anti-sigma-R factor n=1 Tax=Phycicoccus flavus TaxID=2502783 RepID=UPI000FEC103C|nr:mycothiol system anti-sigma-R factor [Phycicoccus flavus]NHA66881.1 mycothiol system anti-sigma-R factor [Phycicoccus flavus]